MPTYRYVCAGCGWKVEKIFRALPSEAKQTSTPCEECDKQATRSMGDEGFFAVGGQHSGIEKAAAFAAQQDPATGRPIFTDENGKTREIKTSRDLDSFTRHNAVGPPVIEKVIRRDGVDVLVPALRNGKVIRGPERLTPMDDASEWIPPSEAATGRPIVNGVVVKGEPMTVDPQTGKRMTVWAQREGGEPDTKEAGVRRPPDGKKWA